MDHPRLLTGFVDIGCNTLQHDNAVALDNIDDLAFDVGEAFENKRCPDMSGINGGQGEPVELVDILTGAGANSDSGVNHVDGGDGDNAFPSLHARAITVVPGPCGDCEGARDAHHHGPGSSTQGVPLTSFGQESANTTGS